MPKTIKQYLYTIEYSSLKNVVEIFIKVLIKIYSVECSYVAQECDTCP